MNLFWRFGVPLGALRRRLRTTILGVKFTVEYSCGDGKSEVLRRCSR